MPTLLRWLRSFVSLYFTCLRAFLFYVLTRLCILRGCVPIYLCLLRTDVPTNLCLFHTYVIKVGLSPSKKLFYLLQCKPFKNNAKWFLLLLKSSFCSQHIFSFWSCRKNSLRKIRLMSKFITSQSF